MPENGSQSQHTDGNPFSADGNFDFRGTPVYQDAIGDAVSPRSDKNVGFVRTALISFPALVGMGLGAVLGVSGDNSGTAYATGDACEFKDGVIDTFVQVTVPPGYHKEGNNCVKDATPPPTGTPNGKDASPTATNHSVNPTATPTVFDACPKIDGADNPFPQVSVPITKTKIGDNCVDATPPPTGTPNGHKPSPTPSFHKTPTPFIPETPTATATPTQPVEYFQVITKKRLDVNRNGRFDDQDRGLIQDYVAFVDLNRNGLLDFGEPVQSGRTDPNGVDSLTFNGYGVGTRVCSIETNVSVNLVPVIPEECHDVDGSRIAENHLLNANREIVVTSTPPPLVDVCLSKDNKPSPEFDSSVPFGWERDQYGNCFPPLIQTPTAVFTLTPTPGVCKGILEIDKIHVDRSKDRSVGDKPMSASFNVDDTSTGPDDDFSMTTSEADGIARKVVRGGVTYIVKEVPREGFEEIDKKSVQKVEVGCGSVKKLIFRNSEIPAGKTPVPTPPEARPAITPQVPVSGSGLGQNVDVTTKRGRFNVLGFMIPTLAGLATSAGLYGRSRRKQA